jgi:hypothetical protein
MDANEFKTNVIRHCLSMEPKYFPIRMAILVEGAIAVEDKSGVCDVYFDHEQWRFTRQDLFGHDPDVIKNPLLEDFGIEILEGSWRVPQIRTIDEMVNFAKNHLTPKKADLRWHDAPFYFNFKIDTPRGVPMRCGSQRT